MKKYGFLSICAAVCLLCGCGAEKASAVPEVSAPPLPPAPDVIISEVQASNKSCFPGPEGNFPDWIELYNRESESVKLSSCSLSAGGHSWSFPEISIGPGEFLLLYCDKNSDGSSGPDFSLSSKGEKLCLMDENGSVMDSFSYENCPQDKSFIKNSGADSEICSAPSPGYPNSRAGYISFQQSLSVTGPLIINEVQCSNLSFSFGGSSSPDWIEIKNISQEEVLADDYILSDIKGKNPFKLPGRRLAPGALLLLKCGSDNGPEFSLSSENEGLFLRDKAGNLTDFINLPHARSGHSQGRTAGEGGSFFFRQPSPGSENGQGFRCYAPMPLSDAKEGVFENCSGFPVELICPEEGLTIRYSLDGSEPDEESPVYDGPVNIEKTSVLRAACFGDGMLKSQTLDLSFIINEGHQLPVLSLVSDYDEFKHMYRSPHEEIEVPASAAFFDGEEHFKISCGAKLHGATSKIAQSKKSLKLNFKSRYEGELQYDLFQNGVSEFSSILVRSAQEEVGSSQLRDILMHELARQCCPELSRQDFRFCVLYIDGEYRGLYALREAHGAEHFAKHRGLEPEELQHCKGFWEKNSEPYEIFRFILNNDMSKEENYRIAEQHLDMESFIAWNILQAYSGNFDINAPNVRWYYSRPEQKIYMALVDLDLGFSNYWDCFKAVFYPHYNYEYAQMTRSLKQSPIFCRQFMDQMQEYFNGPLSDENVTELIDRLAAEIRPEIPRDYQRWGLPDDIWESMIENMKHFITLGNGRRAALANSLTGYMEVPEEDLQSLIAPG